MSHFESIQEMLNVLNAESGIEASTLHEDGRVNSIKDEDNIISEMKRLFKDRIKEPKARHWYDVMIDGIPCQIKASTGGSDNFSSKKAVVYTLTNMIITEVDRMKNGFPVFDNIIRQRRDDNNQRDYPIVVLDKNTNTLHLKTLKTLTCLVPNGNNLPFQINWNKELTNEPVERTGAEAYNFIIGAYIESVKKKLSQHKDALSLLD